MKTEHDYCECGGVDNGVGIQHEPHCPTHTAAAVLADVGRETKRLRAEVERLRTQFDSVRADLRWVCGKYAEYGDIKAANRLSTLLRYCWTPPRGSQR